MTKLEIRERGGEVSFAVRVQPRASRDSIDGVRDGALRVRLSAPPVEGEANEALVRFLAARLQVPKSAVRILSGERGRVKRIAVRGTSAAAVEALANGSDS
jgi:uncharacterized protein (TIGR00251 family)